MGKEKTASPSIWTELVHSGLYKRNQGRIARQVTFAALAVVIGVGCWRLSLLWQAKEPTYEYLIPGVLLLAGLWVSFRIVNLPSFADFLISVEGEMAKVSWPSRTELIRSSIVVIVLIILLAAVLYLYDFIWQWLLKALGVLTWI